MCRSQIIAWFAIFHFLPHFEGVLVRLPASDPGWNLKANFCRKIQNSVNKLIRSLTLRIRGISEISGFYILVSRSAASYKIPLPPAAHFMRNPIPASFYFILFSIDNYNRSAYFPLKPRLVPVSLSSLTTETSRFLGSNQEVFGGSLT